MVIKVVAVQAKPKLADTIRRFLSISSYYLAVQAYGHAVRSNRQGAGEFVDPVRDSSILQAAVRRTGV